MLKQHICQSVSQSVSTDPAHPHRRRWARPGHPTRPRIRPRPPNHIPTAYPAASRPARPRTPPARPRTGPRPRSHTPPLLLSPQRHPAPRRSRRSSWPSPPLTLAPFARGLPWGARRASTAGCSCLSLDSQIVPMCPKRQKNLQSISKLRCFSRCYD